MKSSLLPEFIREIAWVNPGENARSVIYFDQSVLRILLRKPEGSTEWLSFKTMIGLPVSPKKFAVMFVFSPIMIWELVGCSAPNPRSPQSLFRFSELGEDKDIKKLLRELKEFNLQHMDPSLNILEAMERQASKVPWQDTLLRSTVLSYVKASGTEWRNTLALHFAFQGLQEPDLHPGGQIGRISDLIIDLALDYRERGDNLSLYRLFHRKLLDDVQLDRSKEKKMGPSLTQRDEKPSKLKLFKDHVDVEYLHFSTAGGVFGNDKEHLPVISFTFDDPECVKWRIQLLGERYRSVFEARIDQGASLIGLQQGWVVSLKREDFSILGVASPSV